MRFGWFAFPILAALVCTNAWTQSPAHKHSIGAQLGWHGTSEATSRVSFRAKDAKERGGSYRWIQGKVQLFACVTVPPQQPDRLLWHEVRLDDQGKLLSWVKADSPYHHIVTNAWNAFKKIPVQPDGYRTYFTYPTFYGPGDPNHKVFSGRGWCHNPGGVCAMLTDSAILYHAYSGDRVVLQRVREMIDHTIKHGSTKPTDAWASVPYASSDAGDPNYRGATDTSYKQAETDQGRGDGVGYMEPDKVGELGHSYLLFYEVTLEPKYLKAAIRCADALAKNIRKGDESHSPWPFRVDAKTGKKVREQYTANTIGPIKLIDELIRIKKGDIKAYKRARKLAWDWLMRYPMQNNVWSQYFEDVLIYPDYRTNLNQYSPLETARYLLLHPETDPQSQAKAKKLIDFVAGFFAQDSVTMGGLPEKGLQWGAEVVSEQVNDMDKMSSHTARFASVLALWHEKTGDQSAKERAFRSFNWATYSSQANGLVKTSIDEGTGYWFSDGYGDYMRHFQRGMASVPEWAPAKENHILGSTSVVRDVTYKDKVITYTTFDPNSTEVLRLKSKPKAVYAGGQMKKLVSRLSAGGYTVDPLPGGGCVVRFLHKRSGKVLIKL